MAWSEYTGDTVFHFLEVDIKVNLHSRGQMHEYVHQHKGFSLSGEPVCRHTGEEILNSERKKPDQGTAVLKDQRSWTPVPPEAFPYSSYPNKVVMKASVSLHLLDDEDLNDWSQCGTLDSPCERARGQKVLLCKMFSNELIWRFSQCGCSPVRLHHRYMIKTGHQGGNMATQWPLPSSP